MEIARITSLPPFQGLDTFMHAYVDVRDQGPLILTHFSLLLGCAFPLWVVGDHLSINCQKVTGQCYDELSGYQWMSMAGVSSIGIGDAMVGMGCEGVDG